LNRSNYLSESEITYLRIKVRDFESLKLFERLRITGNVHSHSVENSKVQVKIIDLSIIHSARSTLV
jgi:stalled ribosome rescue protein Dom34